MTTALFALGDECAKAVEEFREGRLPEAIALWGDQVKKGICPADQGLMLGVALFNSGDGQRAEQTLEIFVKNFPRSTDGWYNLGLASISTERLPGAARSFKKVLELNPESTRALKMLARVHVAQTENAEAERLLRKAIEVSADDFDAHYLLGRLLQSTDRLVEAEAHLIRVTELNPRSARGFAFLGTVSYALGKFEECEKAFAQALRVNRVLEDPDYVPLLEYGLYLQRVGRPEDALTELRKALHISPGELEVRFELARSLYRLEKLGEARQILEGSIGPDGSDPRVHYLLSRICYEQEDAVCGDLHARLSEVARN
jgi:tetratricopeptide (TPR) repeat protein